MNRSHEFGDLPFGQTRVVYHALDPTGNIRTCVITVSVQSKKKSFVCCSKLRYCNGTWQFESLSFKSYKVMQTACNRLNISSKEAVLSGRNNTEMYPVNSLQASA